MNQLVSVIIPAKDAEKTIEKCIISLLGIDYQNFEVIIIDDGSQDKTAEILGNYVQKIKIITNANCLGPSEARNTAARQARGELVAFTDADCIVDKNWLKELLEGFRRSPEVVSCGGTQEIPEDESQFGRSVAKFFKKTGFFTDYMRKAKGSLMEVGHNPSCNVMYRREVFLKEDGFLAGLWPGEDVELDYRLRKKGYKLIFNPQAIVYHYRLANLKAFLRMMFRYGQAQGFLVRKYGLFRQLHFLAIFSPVLLVLCLAGLLLNARLTLALIILFFIVVRLSFSSLAPLGLFAWFYGFFIGRLFRNCFICREITSSNTIGQYRF
ncbi:MAG: glycosyltransferase [Candidatus Omnitrophota bacterium]